MGRMQQTGVKDHLNFLEEPISAVVARFAHKDILFIHVFRCHLDIVHQGQHVAFPNHLQHEEYKDAWKSSIHVSSSYNAFYLPLLCTLNSSSPSQPHFPISRNVNKVPIKMNFEQVEKWKVSFRRGTYYSAILSPDACFKIFSLQSASTKSRAQTSVRG